MLRGTRGAVFAISMLCFAWVLWPIWRHGQELGETLHGAASARVIVLGVGLYALLTVLMAVAWWWLSGIYGYRPSVRRGYAIWARSQLAKYLPGNAFHYVSRQLMGREAGLSHPALVAAGLLEMGSQLLAAVLIGVAGATLSRSSLQLSLSLPWVVAFGIGCLLASPAVASTLRRFPRTAAWMAELPHLSVAQTLRLFGPSLGLHVAFFIGTGAILLVLMASGWGEATADPGSVVRMYAVAWVAGTVTLGAPAGVGVREAILTLQLEPMIGAAPAAAVALALRLVTTGGDLLTALLGWLLRRRS